jgi:hypothetical protein
MLLLIYKIKFYTPVNDIQYQSIIYNNIKSMSKN